MDRVFLDANVLFSAAYSSESALHRLWRLRNATLCSSRYAVEEARRNLGDEACRDRLSKLVAGVALFEAGPRDLPPAILLPDKDVPILLAAMAASATHLLTGDHRHFGNFLGKRIEGILIETPGQYLKRRLQRL